MNVVMRVERLREHLVRSGERGQTPGTDTSAGQADFSDFSESTGSGAKESDLTDSVDQA